MATRLNGVHSKKMLSILRNLEAADKVLDKDGGESNGG